jgi:hypothetical protein
VTGERGSGREPQFLPPPTLQFVPPIDSSETGVVDDLELLDESEASPRLGEVELRPSWGPEYSVKDVATVRGWPTSKLPPLASLVSVGWRVRLLWTSNVVGMTSGCPASGLGPGTPGLMTL